jgi:hypothetical protein
VSSPTEKFEKVSAEGDRVTFVQKVRGAFGGRGWWVAGGGLGLVIVVVLGAVFLLGGTPGGSADAAGNLAAGAGSGTGNGVVNPPPGAVGPDGSVAPTVARVDPNAPASLRPAPRTAFTSPKPPGRESPDQYNATTLTPIPMPPGSDGCDRNYGSATQCVPFEFPKNTTGKCTWLTDHGFKALPVKGTDRQSLDTNKDGTACGEGDTA